ncbi:hypothetical protein QBC39DRAFT_136709 [Podospora conica]|nr:hypothetical protein QBC39DRAFT_136709 [Schizothecium conicum]
MEQAHPPPGDRPRVAPPFPRTASRSSTSSTRTRMSNNSATSTQQPSSQRYLQTRGSRPPAIERPRSQLSREASQTSRESLPPTMSTYLQERLERERKVNDSERSSSRASNDHTVASDETNIPQGSPLRNGHQDARRPRSSGGTEPAKKKGLGLKEMEQTLSTLHKQNFDLKLELFHRREKQTALEEHVEKLESEKAATDDMNDQLLAELEKRDKAVEEAVAMIVVLEARVEQLIQEREMVRRVEEDGLFYNRSLSRGPDAASTPKMRPLDAPQFDNARALNRMPSFMSEQSEHTANLRNVYLGVRGSVLSLQRTEDAHDVDRAEHNGVSSPTLSVLSESSFLSVYGQKNQSPSSPHAPDSPSSLDGSANDRQSTPGAGNSSPSRPRRSSAARASQFHNINGVLDLAASPLQRLERLEMALSAMGDASRPPTSHQEKASLQHRPLPQLPAQPKTKQEKRDALEKVLTQAHLGRSFSNYHLPPTPDTISTSTLRRFQNSNDTLSREESLAAERSYLALSETTASQASAFDEDGNGGRLEIPGQPNQPASTTAFDSRKPMPGGNDRPIDRPVSPPTRTRSHAQPPVSQHVSNGRWESDDSDDDFGDSVASFDPWIRESLKPDHLGALNPASSVSQAGPGRQNGRISPDLFSFPVSSGGGGWASKTMYGALGGAGYAGSAGNANPRAPMADALAALGDSLPPTVLGSGLAGSSASAFAPARRSSLHAQTGSVPASPAQPSPASSRVKRGPVRPNKTRSNSIDIRPPSHLKEVMGLMQDRAMTVPPKQIHMPPPLDESHDAQSQSQHALPKQRHYPPTASQPPRHRGLNSLFRRSTGSAEPPQAPAPSSAPATETTFKNLPASMMGLPSWGKRASLVDDDRESATPPPILRSKGQARVDNDEGGGAPLDYFDGGAPLDNPTKPGTSGSGSGSGKPNFSGGAPLDGAPVASRNEGGGKLKWLGLGRVTSLRSRGA